MNSKDPHMCLYSFFIMYKLRIHRKLRNLNKIHLMMRKYCFGFKVVRPNLDQLLVLNYWYK